LSGWLKVIRVTTTQDQRMGLNPKHFGLCRQIGKGHVSCPTGTEI